MKIRDLVKVLGDLPPELADAEVELRVYGHSYGSERYRYTHGPMIILRDRHSGAVALATDTGHYTTVKDYTTMTRTLRDEMAEHVDLLFVDGNREKGA